MQVIRFWHLAHGSPVRLTLRDGEMIAHGEGGPTDEGYSWETTTYYFEAGVLRAEWHTDARDCDGRIERSNKAECAARNVRAGVIDSEFAGVVWPAWQHTGAAQRDHAAEAAGY